MPDRILKLIQFCSARKLREARVNKWNSACRTHRHDTMSIFFPVQLFFYTCQEIKPPKQMTHNITSLLSPNVLEVLVGKRCSMTRTDLVQNIHFSAVRLSMQWAMTRLLLCHLRLTERPGTGSTPTSVLFALLSRTPMNPHAIRGYSHVTVSQFGLFCKQIYNRPLHNLWAPLFWHSIKMKAVLQSLNNNSLYFEQQHYTQSILIKATFVHGIATSGERNAAFSQPFLK